MIKKKISRTTFQEHLIDFVRDEMYEAAIKDDGIYSSFKLHNRYFTTGEIRITLRYCKLDCDDKWLPAQRKILYKNCPELGDVRFPYISAETMKSVADRIKMDIVKNDNAIWSTIKVVPWTEHFTVSYDKAYVDKPMTAQEMEIENTKKTLRRLRENSYYGLYPRHSGLTYAFDEYVAADIKATTEAFKAIPRYLTYAFDEKAKEDLKDSLKTWKASLASLDIYSPSKEFLNRVYGTYKKEEKEKKDMNITLMVVPNGMNKDFVNKVKAEFQSGNSQRLFVASTDIGFDRKYDPLKTKYDLFENWIKTGKVDIVYFMLGFEKDPDVRAFESFVRGITEAEVPGKIDVRVVYQKDDIENDIHHLRTLYFDEADANEDAARATGSVVKEANAMKEVYSLDDNSLDIIKHSKGKIDASNELVINEIMDVAFAEEDKPAKKGGKKND